jgi:hypothetical protein
MQEYVLLKQIQQNRTISETGGSRIFRISGETSKTTTAGPDDWRTPLVHYLENPIILLIGKFGGKL